MEKSIGIGIIGTGFARKVQIPAFLACENVVIASVASGSIENARSTAEECGAGHYTADWRETVARDDVDLVCVTTPPNLHLEISLAAIEHGKHILCEKPMAMNVAEAAEMTRAAEGKPLLALIDHELRFQPGRVRAYEMLREGTIGKVRHAKFFFQSPQRADPSVPWNWWSDATVGGGALGAIASHIVDSFNWFLGTEIASLSCQLQTHIKQRNDRSGQMHEVTSDDESNMLLRFRDGELTSDATGLVSVSMTEGPRYTNRLEFYGEKGAMRIGELGEVAVVMNRETDWRPIEVELGGLIGGMPDSAFSRGFVQFAPQIVDAIRTGKLTIKHAATFTDGLSVQKILDAARASDASGKVINL
ncbi:MAG: Gfo/Idh/MocA family oxidoreductase [Acidobacteriota bacterium]